MPEEDAQSLFCVLPPLTFFWHFFYPENRTMSHQYRGDLRNVLESLSIQHENGQGINTMQDSSIGICFQFRLECFFIVYITRPVIQMLNQKNPPAKPATTSLR